jgi:hypothetical protein
VAPNELPPCTKVFVANDAVPNKDPVNEVAVKDPVIDWLPVLFNNFTQFFIEPLS